MKKIGILGHFGGKEEFFDGQTVKTKVLYEELSRVEGIKLYTADTYYVRRNPLKYMFQTVKTLIKCESVIVLLSRPGMRVMFPFLYYWKKFFKIKIYHDVIGSILPDCIDRYKNWKKYLSAFETNWVEFPSMCDHLIEKGVKNASVLPNIKRLKAVEGFDQEKFGKLPLRFCTFSRVVKEKGITDAVETIHKVNREFGKTVAVLDIYGPVYDCYKEEFEELQKDFGETIKYCGIVDFKSSVDTLKEYDILLFPTFHVGEGFPGTIIDAFYSAVPVIATDWSANKEILTDGITGIVYPNDTHEDLYSAVKWTVENGNEVIKMKKNCLAESEKYKADKLIKIIIDAIS